MSGVALSSTALALGLVGMVASLGLLIICLSRLERAAARAHCGDAGSVPIVSEQAMESPVLPNPPARTSGPMESPVLPNPPARTSGRHCPEPDAAFAPVTHKMHEANCRHPVTREVVSHFTNARMRITPFSPPRYLCHHQGRVARDGREALFNRRSSAAGRTRKSPRCIGKS